MATTAQVHSIDSQTGGGELLGRPSVVTAVGIEARNDGNHTADLSIGPPRPDEQVEIACALNLFFMLCRESWCHDSPPGLAMATVGRGAKLQSVRLARPKRQVNFRTFVEK